MNRDHRQRFQSRSANEHRWMISYADFLTLLFAFFVFLFSISSLEKEKFRQVSDTLLQIFDVQPTAIEPLQMPATPEGPDFFNPLYQPEPLPATYVDLNDSAQYHQQSSLIDIQQQLGESFQQLIEQQLFSVSGSESWIEIQLSDSVTFLSGSADITNQAEAVLYEIGKLLSEVNLPVKVEGYSSAAEGSESADAWMLSTLRSANVVRYLQRAGIPGQRLSVVAFGPYQPALVADSATFNGRISIVVSGFGVEAESRQ
ncbi:flagellar motor protein MotB [Reinekea marinisedimentorum]|uniref:Chemotaxis protein MotB n=1 Tax=Reinekea marinisedimentorum TaxID=230495 RepID=A0A4R3I4D8_9GAMM|nr:flagellar motor protein MotB [Reinekea marinisedimentorum]TCS39943.1 chemotaxis protein MotB [Reinekea marinisedimentorum]